MLDLDKLHTVSVLIDISELKPSIKYAEPKDETTNKYTAVSIVKYYHSTGFIVRGSCDPKLIGYCKENPLEVLKKIFADFYVTKVDSYSFFDQNDLDKDTPMIGLSLDSIEPI